MIYHKDAGKVVEATEDSLSPYYGLEGELYYGGPTFYYIKESDGTLSHTLLYETLDTVDQENIDYSDEKYEILKEKSDPEALSYISGETKSLRAPIQSRAMEVYLVPHSEFFYNMDDSNSGYVSAGKNGICGYIALNMVLNYYEYRTTYYDTVTSSNLFVKNSAHRGIFYGASRTTTAYKVELKQSFSRYLYEEIGVKRLGKISDTIPVDIHDVARNYLENDCGLKDNVDFDDWYVYTPIANNAVVRDEVKSGCPVILFGSLKKNDETNKIDHAVTVWKVTFDGWSIFGTYKVYAHYGYDGGTYKNGYHTIKEAYIDGVWGGIYRLKVPERR